MKKRGMETEMLSWWIIALVVLVIMLLGYMVLNGKASDAISYIKNLFVFRR